jgi:ubiquitin C-terminal hydrolase
MERLYDAPAGAGADADAGATADEKKSIIGLANLGNTCFMNAAIQTLRHFPEVTYMCTRGLLNAIAEATNSSMNRSIAIARAFTELIQTLHSGSGGDGSYVLPRGFYETMKAVVEGTVYEHFGQRTPQDAHEFLVWLLDHLFMATAEPRDIPYSVDVEGSKEWADAFRASYSPLAELFFGQMRIQYKCTACDTVHKRYETFNILKVQPLAGRPWDNCIEAELMSEEVIEGYACETCEKAGRPRAAAHKSARVVRLPKLLIFSVKRYTPFGARINTPIVHDNCDFHFDQAFAPESTHPSRNYWYSTIGIIDHLGIGMGGGHYVAQCLSPLYREWWLYDDQGVHPLKGGPVYGAQTYMVFMRAVK